MYVYSDSLNLPNCNTSEMKTKKNPSVQPSPAPSFTSLPDDVIITCLARIPRSYYWRLSRVCKRFRSLLTSKELYEARAHLGMTEQCLYVCQWDRSRQFSQWFTLWINPNQALTKNNKKKTIGKLWVWKPYSDSYSVSKPITVGSEIYIIGGYGVPSSAVRVLNCRSHTWRNAPSMSVARMYAPTCLYEGKIYVTDQEVIVRDEEESFAEVFDTKIQTWERLPDPSKHVQDNNILYIIEEIEGKIHFGSFQGMIQMGGGSTRTTYAYDPKQHKWECFETKTSFFPIENVLWTNYANLWRWYDKDIKMWKDVRFIKSLDEICKRKDGVVRSNYNVVVDFNGNLLVFWDEQVKPSLFSWVHVTRNYQKSIWCAEISLEECDGGEIWGTIEWVDMVHTFPISSHISHRLLVSI